MLSDDDSFYSACDSSASLDSFDEPETLRNLLDNTFVNFNSSFNVCHINAQSIPSHYSDLLETFSSSSSSVQAILISESWLKPSLSTFSYSLPGFVLIRNDRIGKGGGGVAIYLRSNLSFSIIASSPSQYSASAEYLFLEIQAGRSRLVLGVVYCPPSVEYFSSLETVLESLSADYLHHIIMGDFNTDLLNTSTQRAKLLYILSSVNLSILPCAPTHHNPDSPDTWLDLIITSSPQLVVNYGQLSASGFSRHDLLYLAYKLKPPKSKPDIIWVRNFARMDPVNLEKDASAIDFSPVYGVSSVNDKVSIFTDITLKLFDAHAPVRSIKVKRPPAPWITKGVRMAMTRRDRAFRKFKRDRCDDNWRLYKVARNRCNHMVRAAKRCYFHDNISNSSSADVWKFLKSLGVGKHSENNHNISFPLNDFNSHFSAGSILSPIIKSTTISEIISLATLQHETFSFSFVSVDEVRKIFVSIKSKAVGCDNVSRLMISSVLEHFLPVITHIINFSLSSGVFPASWRKAYIIPLPKIANPTQLSNYRPISILPFLSKLLESIVHQQLSAFICRNNLLSQFQSGFRPGHSTTTALLKVTEDIREGMENRMVTVLVLIDFSNAFNMVDHDILLAMLQNLKFSSTAVEWFSSYLRGRQQAVINGRDLSDWCQLSTGVPQGGILSPLLFSIFINSLSSQLSCSYHFYADDLQIYTQADVNSLSDAIARLNMELANLHNWSRKFGISVNPNKCQAIIIGSVQQLSKLDVSCVPPVTFDGSIIPYSDSVKNLGVYFDTTLCWSTQIKNISSSVFAKLSTLNRLRNFLPVKVKTTLVQSLILPIIDYADVCFPDLNEVFLGKLDRLVNNCIRFIFCLRKFDHVSLFRTQLKWLPIRQRRHIRILNTVFSILFDKHYPNYLKNKFQFLRDTHNRQLRSSETLALSIPLHRSGFISSSFAVQAARLWNDLPEKLRQATSKQSFKKNVRAHFLKLLHNC